MQRIEVRATDDAGNAVTLIEVRDEQIVETTHGPIVYKIQPQYFGPDGESLVKARKGTFRSATGKRFRTATYDGQ